MVSVNLNSFVKIHICSQKHRKYLHQGCCMRFIFFRGKYFFSCQKFRSLLESVEHSSLYLLYFYHIIIILSHIDLFFLALECVTVSLFQLSHEELIFLLKIPFLLLESHLWYRVYRLFMIVLNMMERKKEQHKFKSSCTRQGNILYKEKIYRISIKSGLCV